MLKSIRMKTTPGMTRKKHVLCAARARFLGKAVFFMLLRTLNKDSLPRFPAFPDTTIRFDDFIDTSVQITMDFLVPFASVRCR